MRTTVAKNVLPNFFKEAGVTEIAFGGPSWNLKCCARPFPLRAALPCKRSTWPRLYTQSLKFNDAVPHRFLA